MREGVFTSASKSLEAGVHCAAVWCCVALPALRSSGIAVASCNGPKQCAQTICRKTVMCLLCHTDCGTFTAVLTGQACQCPDHFLTCQRGSSIMLCRS